MEDVFEPYLSRALDFIQIVFRTRCGVLNETDKAKLEKLFQAYVDEIQCPIDKQFYKFIVDQIGVNYDRRERMSCSR